MDNRNRLKVSLSKSRNMSLDLEDELRKSIQLDRKSSMPRRFSQEGMFSVWEEELEDPDQKKYNHVIIIASISFAFGILILGASLAYVYVSGDYRRLKYYMVTTEYSPLFESKYRNFPKNENYLLKDEIPVYLNAFNSRDTIVHDVLTKCAGLRSTPLVQNDTKKKDDVDFYFSSSLCHLERKDAKHYRVFLYMENPVFSVLTNNGNKMRKRNNGLEDYFLNESSGNILTRSLVCKRDGNLNYNDFMIAKKYVRENFQVVRMSSFKKDMRLIFDSFNWKFDKRIRKCMNLKFQKLLKKRNFETKNMYKIAEKEYYDLRLYNDPGN